VRNDLSLAEQTLAEHGVIALDDFMRLEWPDVSAGYFSWFERRSKPIVPLAIGFNKLYLCYQSRVPGYQEVLRGSGFLRFFLAKHYNFGGIEIPVYQQFLEPDWPPGRRLVEYVKLIHPDLYVNLKALQGGLLRLFAPWR
jgi:hypothetical protein